MKRQFSQHLLSNKCMQRTINIKYLIHQCLMFNLIWYNHPCQLIFPSISDPTLKGTVQILKKTQGNSNPIPDQNVEKIPNMFLVTLWMDLSKVLTFHVVCFCFPNLGTYKHDLGCGVSILGIQKQDDFYPKSDQFRNFL